MLSLITVCVFMTLLFYMRMHTLTGAIAGCVVLAWMALNRLLSGTKGPIKEETIVNHRSQSMV